MQLKLRGSRLLADAPAFLAAKDAADASSGCSLMMKSEISTAKTRRCSAADEEIDVDIVDAAAGEAPVCFCCAAAADAIPDKDAPLAAAFAAAEAIAAAAVDEAPAEDAPAALRLLLHH